MFKYCLSFTFTMLALSGLGQEKIYSVDEQIWLGYFNQTRLSNRWGFWLDAHLRTKDDFVGKLSQAIFRPGVTYYVNDQVKLTAGYAYINHFPSDNHKHISQPEHRLWQQVQWHSNARRTRVMQWIRLEERFRRKIANDSTLGEGYNFNYRLRYNFMIQFALSPAAFKKRSFSWVVNDEVHINFGKSIVYNYFDQNRFFTGLNYFVSDHANIQLGYMNLFQQLPQGNQYRVLHTIRAFFFHNIDLRKKPSSH